MDIAIKIAIGVFCLMFSVLGAGMVFSPASMLEVVHVQPDSIEGWSTLRGNIGGLFLGTMAVMVLGLMRREAQWFHAVSIYVGLVAFGRIVGLALDGFDAAVVPILVLELVIAGVCVAAAQRLCGPYKQAQ